MRKNNWMNYLIGVFIPFSLLLNSANAATTPTPANSSEKNTIINSTTVGNAQDWQLTDSEWNRYLELMQGVNVKWYPQLTPPEILGMNADNPVEQNHFAELVAKVQHEKLARELAFNNAINQALKRLYPDEPLILPFDLSPFNPMSVAKADNTTALQAGDHLVLFIECKNPLNFNTLPPLIALINHHPKTILDIFCLNAFDATAIRQWAKSNHIPANLVAENRITLNQDKGKFIQTVGNVPLPYLLLVRQGQSKVVTWESLR